MVQALVCVFELLLGNENTGRCRGHTRVTAIQIFFLEINQINRLKEKCEKNFIKANK